MNIITTQMSLFVDKDMTDIDDIVSYLNDKLYGDPEFFGGFIRESIIEITSEDGDLIYHANRNQ